ncbi:hypothetical protein SAMN05443999_11438 [Roseovarius azorensis]|uniref:Uncharacterized protein n=1 Tax=Roseovarius azorensis TaxID=1287727 RepID=A0A1H7W362_9RHOB|nr:hypothetical protein [Roseovarius azorensis]SEM15966.1 hypothetical protein SAMN05443999_11438 [Roseovarius azorensis]
MTDGPTLVNCFVLTATSFYTAAMQLLKHGPAVLLAALTACAPPALYYKPGASPAQVESNLTNCAVAALDRVPRDIRTRFIPAQYSTRTYCNSYGRCYPRTYLVQPARTESYDANAALRGRVTEQCMAEAGYRPVSLPQCDPAEVRLSALPADPAQPPLGPGSCALRLASGKWRIVTPQ